jgi:hypothetical protein
MRNDVRTRRSVASMMFGGGAKKSAGATIKVEGKTIVASATPCNLRKELIANGVGTSNSTKRSRKSHWRRMIIAAVSSKVMTNCHTSHL